MISKPRVEKWPMSTFLTNDFHSTLLVGIPDHAGGLDVVSGYVSSAAIYWAMTKGDVSKLSGRVPRGVPRIRVLVGMVSDGSVSMAEHIKFKELCNTYGRSVRIRYADPTSHPLVHSKVYAVREGETPRYGYLGSANFTGMGLGLYGHRQENTMVEVDATDAESYFESVYSKGIDCTSELAEKIFHFPRPDELKERRRRTKITSQAVVLETLEFPLYNVRANKPYAPGAGINWGIASINRVRSAPDEAYMSISGKVSRSGFFPPRNVPFIVNCADGREMLLRGASGELQTHPSGKDLSTLPSNSTLGNYIRGKLGVPSGTYVDLDILDNYGRRSVSISKLSDGSYVLDFEVGSSEHDLK